MRPVPDGAKTQFDVFTAEQACAAGWTASALRYAARVGDLERIRPGAYAPRLEQDLEPWRSRLVNAQRTAVAVSLTNRGVPLSHRSAAVLLGLPVVAAPTRACVTFGRGRRGAMPGVHRHRGRLHRGEVARIGRILLLSAERTVVDMGCELGVDAALAAADFGLRHGVVDPYRLDLGLARCRGWPGVRAAERAVGFADARSESVLESLSRWRIHAAGLPAPEPQVRIYDANGVFCGRVDFYWDEFGVVGECDGRTKYRDADDSLIGEKDRQGWVEDTGLIVARWGWSDLDPFAPTRSKLRNAMARGLRPDRAPRRWHAVPEPWPQLSVTGSPLQ